MPHARDEEKLAKRFAEILVELRLSRNLSVRAAARKIGMDHTRLLSLEKGIERTTGKPTLPSAEQAVQIARAYQVPKERLLVEAGYVPWFLDGAQVEQFFAVLLKEFVEAPPSAHFFVAGRHQTDQSASSSRAESQDGDESMNGFA